MKLRRILFIIALFIATMAQAQTLQEVVYLKNGSVIRGIIIEQVPNVSLKVQTADGSILAYPMDEVEKITKEPMVNSYNTSRNAGSPLTIGALPRGYRGFVDAGYSFGVGDFAVDRVEFSTSHGYQIFPYLFAGLGVGAELYISDGDASVEIPLFVHLRGSLPCHRIVQPFIDWKIGYTVGDSDGFYMTPAVGCRFAVSELCGVSLSIGYTLQNFKIYWGNYTWWKNYGGVSLKVGFDF